MNVATLHQQGYPETTLLTLGMHVHDGYSTLFVCYQSFVIQLLQDHNHYA